MNTWLKWALISLGALAVGTGAAYGGYRYARRNRKPANGGKGKTGRKR